jgi:nucleoid-associated protein YgaU
MSLIHTDLDIREEAALAHYRAAQEQQQQQLPQQRQQVQVQQAASPSMSSRRATPRREASPVHDHVGQPLPRGSRLPERQGGDAAPTWVTYQVQRGDTLRGIADWFYGDRSRWLAIFAANRSAITDPLALQEGTELIIPRQRGSKQLA